MTPKAINQKIPSGRMCMACEKRDADCSALQFNTMTVIKAEKDGFITVKCMAFNPVDQSIQAQPAINNVANGLIA